MNDPVWYKDAIIYELHVKAFYDSNADGIVEEIHVQVGETVETKDLLVRLRQ